MIPSPLRAVGIDGGYLRLAGHRRRQDGWFEVIVGKSMRAQDAGHSFAYVHKLEHRPADRMLNFLLREGVQPSQPVTFLSDGGDTVRFAQLGFGERGEYVLDWFHIAMRIQNLEQMIKGRPAHCDGPSNAALIKALHSAKWHLWHGCPYPALRRLESLGWDLDAEASPEEAKLLGKLEEFQAGYKAATQPMLRQSAQKPRKRLQPGWLRAPMKSADSHLISRKSSKRSESYTGLASHGPT